MEEDKNFEVDVVLVPLNPSINSPIFKGLFSLPNSLSITKEGLIFNHDHDHSMKEMNVINHKFVIFITQLQMDTSKMDEKVIYCEFYEMRKQIYSFISEMKKSFSLYDLRPQVWVIDQEDILKEFEDSFFFKIDGLPELSVYFVGQTSYGNTVNYKFLGGEEIEEMNWYKNFPVTKSLLASS